MKWTVADVMEVMEERYPTFLQESWDKNGLIVGDPDQPVEKILLAVDPVEATAAQACEGGYDMMITHHPLYLRGTSFVSRLDYKGRIVHDLIKSDVALLNAHTSADAATRGVAWALAQAVGIEGVPFDPVDEDEAGNPRGLGRIGELPEPMTLEEFAAVVAKALPAGPHGILIGAPGGDLKMQVQTVAVSGGSGDSFLNRARELGADVYVTADLRHHPASEHLEAGGPALISGSHWATEWLWLPHLADDLEAAAKEAGVELEIDVSRFVTEPWHAHMPTLG
ncbi:MAG: Nif3-like dinuclear metal center hexameric protein [Actinomycetaceae bacterium]|nr:Nif3-like dinuclear metal center hexameric protein [Actinomycetaceae bacterium]